MKKIFLTFILITTAGFSHAKVERLQTTGTVWIECINNYVFIVGRTGGVTQFMVINKEGKVVPMYCFNFKK